MYERKIPVDIDCGMEMAREVLIGKWKMHLLYYISQGVIRPGQLQKKIPGASRRVLNIQLNELEAQGMVSKTIYNQLPLKVEYSLTDIGDSILPVISVIGNWGTEHFDHLQQVFLNNPRLKVDQSKLEARAV